MKKTTTSPRTKARNKQVRNYSFSTNFVAGIVLSGQEVKWVKQSKVNLDSSYIRVRGGEAWLCKVHFGSGFVDPSQASAAEHVYKLLLHKSELATLAQADMH
jgi:SsrA-binding protein